MESSIHGVYCDIRTGHTVYTTPTWREAYLAWNGKEGESVRPDRFDFDFSDLSGALSETKTSDEEGAKHELDSISDISRPSLSREWLAEKAEEQEERRTPSNALEWCIDLFDNGLVEGKTPQEILGIPLDADLLEAHKAYKALVRLYHPDKVHAQVREFRERFFEGFAPKGEKDSFRKLLAQIKALYGSQLDAWEFAKSKDEIDTMTAGEKEQYNNDFRSKIVAAGKGEVIANHLREIEYELTQRAGARMTLINRAWEAISKGASMDDLLGLNILWAREEYAPYGTVWSIDDHIYFRNGEKLTRRVDFKRAVDSGPPIIKKVGPAYLSCALGYDPVHSMLYTYNRIYVPIKMLFAFIEVRSGKQVHPSLLSDVAEEFELDAGQVERLRRLMVGGADPNHVVNTILAEISRPADESEEDTDRFWDKYSDLYRWIDCALLGPEYDTYEHYPGERVGIEIGINGNLHLTLLCQSNDYRDYYRETTYPIPIPMQRVVFPQEDMAVLKQIAYSKTIDRKSCAIAQLQ